MFLKQQSGSSAVEFALVLPILVILLFGIVEFGIILYDKAVITNASREGARYGILFREPGAEVACSDITSRITSYTSDNLLTFGTATAVNIDYSPSSCTPAAGSELTVTVRYQYDYLVLPGFVGGLIGPIDLEGQTIMVKE